MASWTDLPPELVARVATHLGLPDLHAARLGGLDCPARAGVPSPLREAASWRLAGLRTSFRRSACDERSPVEFSASPTATLSALAETTTVDLLSGLRKLVVKYHPGSRDRRWYGGVPCIVATPRHDGAGEWNLRLCDVFSVVDDILGAPSPAPVPIVRRMEREAALGRWWDHLTSLTVVSFLGTSFPGWVVALPALTALEFSACPSLRLLSSPTDVGDWPARRWGALGRRSTPGVRGRAGRTASLRSLNLFDCPQMGGVDTAVIALPPEVLDALDVAAAAVCGRPTRERPLLAPDTLWDELLRYRGACAYPSLVALVDWDVGEPRCGYSCRCSCERRYGRGVGQAPPLGPPRTPPMALPSSLSPLWSPR